MSSRPMLACKCEDVNRLRFPVLGTPKLDGIRALTTTPLAFGSRDQKCDIVSRNLKLIPNQFLQLASSRDLRPGLDGELLAYPDHESWLSGKLPTFQQCSSAIMSHDGFPSFRYYVFDICPQNLGGLKDPGYQRRCEILAGLTLPEYVVKVLPVTIPDVEHLAAYEAACLSEGYEGVMIRTLDSPYKEGRSTFKEQWLVKIKRFEDSEFEVLEVIERQTNNNPQTKNANGYSERSTHKSGLTPAGDMGCLRARDLKTGVEFSIGTGFDAQQRANIWIFRSTYIGAIGKYKFQPHGVKEAPRFPVFVGWRHREDMS
jgi:DNA ligase 1